MTRKEVIDKVKNQEGLTMNKAQACTIVMNIFDDRYSEEDKLEACRVVCSMNTNSILRKGDYFSALKWVVEKGAPSGTA